MKLRTTKLTNLPPEFTFIRRHFSDLAGPGALGLTDDAAVFTPPPGRDLVIAADAMVENVHFLPDDPAETIGRKLLRCNLSDLAAMGARPEGWLLTVARPPSIEDKWFEGFCRGIKEDQTLFNLSLLGGDTTSTSGPLVLSLTILGSVPPGHAIKRQGIRAGDGLWVTGTIGDGALGLRALQGIIDDPSGYLAYRYRMPQPRVGAPLYGLASGAMDVSDGLLQDAGHLARENALGVTVYAADVPFSRAALECGPEWLETCLTGGDDYELLFAVPPDKEKALLQSPFLETVEGAIPVTRIGVFDNKSDSVTVIDKNEKILSFKKFGWSHF
ncbi:thiamine-phosphate kinase [Acetobacter senegalensis]|uniref:thiamine-phosphate kinase n=1 Tax=Acetobacter senegalensis TaxID=446692 RepID=UPI002651EFE8|nr:thiamine-phosphate kinase [Acetobacter senegalensis]MDN7354281.1 thiamine-phosphate kinase [Acetobacter senegalensis]